MAIAIYARQSVEKENSISCETQVEYCKATLKPDERKEKIYEFVDEGFTGANTDREGFQKMMRLVERGSITKIYVYKLDRISRSLSDFSSILDTLEEHDTKFSSATEGFDTSTDFGKTICQILMVFAELERKNIIMRVSQAYKYRSEKKFYMGGRRPYGFNLESTVIDEIKTKMLVANPEEAAQVRYIFESYAVDGVSLRMLMDNLVANNILPIKGSWSTAKLSAILKNPIYVCADNAIYDYYNRQGAVICGNPDEFDGIHGVQMYGKSTHSASDMSDIKIVPMTHEGLVPSALWLKCQRKLEDNKQIGNALSNTTSWLGGKIACKSCGRTMTCTKGGAKSDGSRTRYFSCTGKMHNRICKGPSATIYADALEDAVYELISEKLSTLKQCRKKISTDNAAKINVLKNRVSEISIREKSLAEKIFSDEFNKAMISLMNTQAESLATEKQSLLEQISILEEADSEIVSVVHLAKRWRNANYRERKSVCHVLIDKIYICENGDIEVAWNI